MPFKSISWLWLPYNPCSFSPEPLFFPVSHSFMSCSYNGFSSMVTMIWSWLNSFTLLKLDTTWTFVRLFTRHFYSRFRWRREGCVGNSPTPFPHLNLNMDMDMDMDIPIYILVCPTFCPTFRTNVLCKIWQKTFNSW